MIWFTQVLLSDLKTPFESIGCWGEGGTCNLYFVTKLPKEEIVGVLGYVIWSCQFCSNHS